MHINAKIAVTFVLWLFCNAPSPEANISTGSERNFDSNMCTFFICSQRTHDLKEGWEAKPRMTAHGEACQVPTTAIWNPLPRSLIPLHTFDSSSDLSIISMMTVWDNSAQIHTDPMVQKPNCLHEAEEVQLPLPETPWPGFWIRECADDTPSEFTESDS